MGLGWGVGWGLGWGWGFGLGFGLGLAVAGLETNFVVVGLDLGVILFPGLTGGACAFVDRPSMPLSRSVDIPNWFLEWRKKKCL